MLRYCKHFTSVPERRPLCLSLLFFWNTTGTSARYIMVKVKKKKKASICALWMKSVFSFCLGHKTAEMTIVLDRNLRGLERKRKITIGENSCLCERVELNRLTHAHASPLSPCLKFLFNLWQSTWQKIRKKVRKKTYPNCCITLRET